MQCSEDLVDGACGGTATEVNESHLFDTGEGLKASTFAETTGRATLID